jgi:hypothetical protein
MTATNQSDNKPIENIVHNFLELQFEAVTTESTIRIDLDKDYSVDCLAYGFHNMDEAIIEFRDILDNLLGLVLLLPGGNGLIYEGENIFYLTNQIDGIRRIDIITFTTASFLQIGNLSFGLCLEMPRFLQGSEQSIDIRDSIFESGSGQSGGNRQRNLKNHPLSFPDVENSKKKEIETYLNFVQRSVPHYIDIYPNAVDEQKPIYVKQISNSITEQKKRIRNFRYNINISWRQAR